MNIKFIIQILLDVDWVKLGYKGVYNDASMTSHLDESWVKGRINMFEKLTLPSLLQQTCQPFDIMLLCGTEYKSITGNHKWHSRIKLFYDIGEEFITGQKADYLIITSIDSDDLYHRHTIQEIQNNLILTNRRECLIFRKHYLWDMMNKFINLRQRRSPAFFTHIFPRKLYQNWPEYKKQHFVVHIDAGGKLLRTKELKGFMACVTRHLDNHQYRRRHLEAKDYLSKETLEKKSKEFGFVNDNEKMLNILEPFGVDRKTFEEFSS